jgi:poly(A) polymerase Pap1
MKEEFKRALSIVQTILNQGAENWDELFQPSDFFAVQQHYLAVEIYTSKSEEEGAWCGFCESRICKLVDGLAYIPVLKNILAFPKKFPLLSIEIEKKEDEKVNENEENADTNNSGEKI